MGVWTWHMPSPCQEERNLHNMWPGSRFHNNCAFPHATEVQGSYWATFVFTFHHKVLTRTFLFFKRGSWFCTRHGYWHSVHSHWMGQKFNLPNSNWHHVGLLPLCSQMDLLCTKISVWNQWQPFIACWHQRIRQQSSRTCMAPCRSTHPKIANGKQDKAKWRPGPWQR